jgi:hypothetical protein
VATILKGTGVYEEHDRAYVVIGTDNGVWLSGDDAQELVDMMHVLAYNFPDVGFSMCEIHATVRRTGE